jgi:hypothetical protein
MPEQRIEGTFRHHGGQVVGRVRTTDAATPPPLGSGLPGEAEGDSVPQQQPAVGHRDDMDGACGCSACTKRRTTDAPIRSLRDINRRNRQLHSQR